MKKAPTTLIILGGFGLREETAGNAVRAAKTPVLDRLAAKYAHTSLAASGADVGLPEGRRGNGATGLSNIEAGRVVPQPLPRIDRAIADGTFFENPAYTAAMDACLEQGTALHLMGLLSDGGVHSSLEHLYALLKLASIRGVGRVYLHCFLDGRDAPPESGRGFLEQTLKTCAEFGVGRLATVMGRWYAMDRGRHWERVEEAYDALVYGAGVQTDDPLRAVAESYREGVFDERMEPIVCDRDGMISDNDSVIFFNFRADRVLPLARALVDPAFGGFQRERFPVKLVCNADCGAALPDALAAFPQPPPENGLGAFLESVGLTGTGTEDAEQCVKRVLSGEYDALRLYLDGCSAAGHTGDFDKAVAAVEAADAAVGAVVDATLQMGGIAIVTASHGNVEQMLDADGGPLTMDTTNRVPFLLCGAGTELREGRLADVAPTILDVLGIAQPEEMTGRTLIVR
ncbi:MAG: 2,3-bisphosphoglycerate-independent phosphoglycerate mutase [Oscillospiraceae bacterium]|nr:2,3-bisphosphoglycerate-independent phosphoglycerate mutase [Oscillospiraceae bacterium]